jgi:hypothetical protein
MLARGESDLQDTIKSRQSSVASPMLLAAKQSVSTDDHNK